MSYYDTLLKQLADSADHPQQYVHHYNNRDVARSDGSFYRMMANILESHDTARVLFDARQAALFDEADEFPAHDKLHMPFKRFYVEFTEPVALQAQEPDHSDYLRAFMVITSASLLKETAFPGVGDLAVITAFLDGDDNSYCDRTFYYHPSTGEAWVRRSTAAALGSDAPPGFEFAFPCGYQREDRIVSWWEDCSISYAHLLSWMLGYMMAKGIRIEQEAISRQQRRWYEQRNKLPRFWHKVVLDPKIVYASGDGHDEGSKHRYRYDVVGHLRFGRHRTGRKDADGNVVYSETIEWVPPHQRGLANDLYIPKTTVVKSGRRIAREPMQQYFGVGT